MLVNRKHPRVPDQAAQFYFSGIKIAERGLGDEIKSVTEHHKHNNKGSNYIIHSNDYLLLLGFG